MQAKLWSALSLVCLIGSFNGGCIGGIEGGEGDTGEAADDLSDRHPSDEMLADDFDDGLAAALEAGEAIPALGIIEDGDVAEEALTDLASGDRSAESASSTLPHCGSTAKSGEYCGGDKVSNASGSRLYRCSGPNTAAKLVSVCSYGCKVAPAGSDDFCNPKPPPTCDSTAKTGDYCGGDKVSYGSPNTLYHCSGPGHATALNVCSAGCVVAPAGSDDHCKAASVPDAGGACPHVSAVLKWGIHPTASDRLRCAGVSAARIMQTIGSAAASAGTHAQDGVYNGHAYSAATDISVKGLSESQVRSLVARLDALGFAAFYRNPGYNGWPSYEIRHMHVVFAGARMKSSLRSQIYDFLAGRNGLASHSAYTFYQPPASVKAYVQKIFNAAN
ncbi:MAG: hypothetical protein ACXVEF_29955 [Polyangiales bacterium]